MAERKTIEHWGRRLNVEGEMLDIPEAMLLHLGHQNARLEAILGALQDMQMRLQRLEMFAEDVLPGYAQHAERVSRKQEQQRQAALAPPNGVPHAV